MAEVGCLKDGCFQNLQVEGNMTITANGSLGGLVLGHEVLTGSGAVSPTIPITFVDTTGGAAAITLSAAGAVAGQVKIITMVKDSGSDATLTLQGPEAGAGAANTIVFNTVGQTVTLVNAADDTGAIIGWAVVGIGSGAVSTDTSVAGMPALGSA